MRMQRKTGVYGKWDSGIRLLLFFLLFSGLAIEEDTDAKEDRRVRKMGFRDYGLAYFD